MPIVASKKLKKGERGLFELLVGFACNQNCRFCSIDFDKRRANGSTEELLDKIYQARKDGFKYLGIGGGEPTIRKDLPALIEAGRQLKFETIRIETNGLALAYPKYCERLANAGLDFVKFSIHGPNAEIHDYLTRFPGSFDYIMRAIDNLRKLGVRIEVNTVITKQNYEFYPEFLKILAAKGIGTFVFIYSLYEGNMAENWKEIGVKMSDAAPYLRQTLDMGEKLELDNLIIINIPYCIFPPDYDGKLLEVGNMRVGSPGETVEGNYRRLKAKAKLKQCRQCCFYDRCEGVWRNYIERFGSDEIKPRFK